MACRGLRRRLYDTKPTWLRSGLQKRLKHHARRALQMSKRSKDIVANKVANSRWPKRAFNYDIVEIFGGSSMISIRGSLHWGLRVLQPIDVRVGIDLRARKMRRWTAGILDSPSLSTPALHGASSRGMSTSATTLKHYDAFNKQISPFYASPRTFSTARLDEEPMLCQKTLLQLIANGNQRSSSSGTSTSRRLVACAGLVWLGGKACQC